MSRNGLTTKQKVFVEQYLQCWNATEAARRAGYSERSIRTIASENLAKPNIKLEIDTRIAELKMSADEILLRLADQARGDIGDFANIENGSDLANHPLSRIVKKYKKRIYHPKDTDSYDEIELELYDAHAPLVDLGKAHGLFADRIEHTGKDGGPIEFKEAEVELPKDD